jgi:hypothetical protein
MSIIKNLQRVVLDRLIETLEYGMIENLLQI